MLRPACLSSSQMFVRRNNEDNPKLCPPLLPTCVTWRIGLELVELTPRMNWRVESEGVCQWVCSGEC